MFMASFFKTPEFLISTLFAMVAFGLVWALRSVVVAYVALCFDDNVKYAHLDQEEFSRRVHRRVDRILYPTWFVVCVLFTLAIYLT